MHARELGQRGVVVFGESLGGAVGIYLASHFPEKVCTHSWHTYTSNIYTFARTHVSDAFMHTGSYHTCTQTQRICTLAKRISISPHPSNLYLGFGSNFGKHIHFDRRHDLCGAACPDTCQGTLTQQMGVRQSDFSCQMSDSVLIGPA